MGWEGGRGGRSGIITIAEKWLKISFLTVFLSVPIIFLVILDSGLWTLGGGGVGR